MFEWSSLVLHLHVWVNPKFFPTTSDLIILVDVQPLTINQSIQYNINKRKTKQLKLDIKRIKENIFKSCLQELKSQMNEKEKLPVKISTEKGVSKWLTLLPITEDRFELSVSLRKKV